MTTEVELVQRSVYEIGSHSDVPRPGHRTSRAAYVVFLLAVLFGSFFTTLWLTEPQVPSALDNGSDAERLAAYTISNSSDLAKSAYDANLIPSRRLSGYVDGIRRIDERDVGLAGWAADREGTPLTVLNRGHLV